MKNYFFSAWKKEDRDVAVIQFQKYSIAVLLLLVLLLLLGWMTAPSRLRLYLPPDLHQGAVLNPQDIPEPFLYSFAYELWQELNHWPSNGSVEAINHLHTYAAYLTPEFQAVLKLEVQELSRSGQSQRQRFMQGLAGAAFDSRSVKKLSASTWEVDLTMHLQEYKNDQRVKEAVIRYPLKITRHDVSPSSNPYGLVLAGYVSPPQRLPWKLVP